MGIFEVFYAPGKLFSSLPERKGAWILPFVLNIVLVTAIAALTIHYIGLDVIIRQQLEGTRIPPEQLETIIRQAVTAPAWRNYLGPLLSTALFQPMLAGILYAFALMANKNAKYVDQLALVAYAYFPYYVITCLMSALIVISSPDPSSLNIKNLIASNAGAFLDKNQTSKGMYSLATSIDALSFAEMFLLAFGFSKVNRSKMALALAVVVGMWILYVSVKMALSVIF